MGGWGHEGELEIPEDLDYVVSDGTKMPFADSSFDLIVSRSSMPFVLGSKQEVISFMKEINRILKDGGEFRFGPGMGGFNNKIYNKGELFTEEEEKSLSRDERVERKNMKAEEFIRGIEAEDGRDMGDGLSVLNISKGDREDLSFVYKK
jgi:SAM-dependent methyltransferase